MPGVSASLPGRAETPADDGPSSSSQQGASTAQSSGSDGSSARPGGADVLGDVQSGQSGISTTNSSILGAPSGDYSLDTLPDGVLSGRNPEEVATTPSTGAMTTSERAAVLDEQLRRGYEQFDGFILGERERAQAESNAAGAGAEPGAENGAGGGEAMPQILGAAGNAQVATQSPPMPGGQNTETFPPPEDIPSGRDDDVVARQLREAAMSEPDPELREALWDEYRNYTGLSKQ